MTLLAQANWFYFASTSMYTVAPSALPYTLCKMQSLPIFLAQEIKREIEL